MIKFIAAAALSLAPAVNVVSDDSPDIPILDSAALASYLAVDPYADTYCALADDVFFSLLEDDIVAVTVLSVDGRTVNVMPDDQWGMFEGYIVMMFERNTDSRLTDRARQDLIAWWLAC